MIEYLLSEPPDLLGFLIAALAAVAAICVHEYAHALTAWWQGDPTARVAGRMTLHPRRHLDPVGSFMILIVGFGWGRPVPVATNKLRGGKTGAILVALAGPAANVLLAFIFAVAIGVTAGDSPARGAQLLLIPFYLNILIALFNLIPVPPLDGFSVLLQVLPPRRSNVIYFLEKWGFLILLVVAFLLFRPFVAPLAGLLGQVLLRLAGL